MPCSACCFVCYVDICRVLFVVFACLLFVVRRSLFVVCLLVLVRCSLFVVVRYLLCVFVYSLLLLVVRCSLRVVCRLVVVVFFC